MNSLIAGGTNVNQVTVWYTDVLIKTAQYGYSDLSRKILDAGGDVTTKTNSGDSALSFAAAGGFNVIIE